MIQLKKSLLNSRKKFTQDMHYLYGCICQKRQKSQEWFTILRQKANKTERKLGKNSKVLTQP